MKTLFWLVTIGSIAIIFFVIRYAWRKYAERQRAEEARAAEFLAQMTGVARPATAAPPASPAPTHPDTLGLQKLLFDAARKAGEAGEPALAIQLYGRLLARFPETAFAAEVRTAAELQKKKLAKT